MFDEKLTAQLRSITDHYGRLELLGFLIQHGAIASVTEVSELLLGALLGEDTSALTAWELILQYHRDKRTDPGLVLGAETLVKGYLFLLADEALGLQFAGRYSLKDYLTVALQLSDGLGSNEPFLGGLDRLFEALGRCQMKGSDDLAESIAENLPLNINGWSCKPLLPREYEALKRGVEYVEPVAPETELERVTRLIEKNLADPNADLEELRQLKQRQNQLQEGQQ